MAFRLGGILRTRTDFRRLWFADAVSQLGTFTSGLALPLLAVLTLHATAGQTALIRTATTTATLLVGLPAGAWCDRMRRRPVLIAADLGRAVLLGSLPIAAWLGVLHLPQIYLVVLLVGVGTTFFDVAHRSYLPRLVEPDQLVEANAKIQANMSVAAVAAPSLGGLLVGWLGAAVGVLVDAVSYLISAVGLARIGDREPAPVRPETGPGLRAEIAAGLRFVFGHRLLRPLTLWGATEIFFQSGQMGIMTVFLVRDLHLSPLAIGLLSSLGLCGAVLAAVTAGPLAGRLGDARVLRWSGLALSGGALLLPLTGRGVGLTWLVLSTAVCGFSIITWNVLSGSMNQRLCPPDLLGRMNASLNVVYFGLAPVGSLLGGGLAETIGLRATLWVTQVGIAVSVLWLFASPLRALRSLPVSAAAAAPH